MAPPIKVYYTCADEDRAWLTKLREYLYLLEKDASKMRAWDRWSVTAKSGTKTAQRTFEEADLYIILLSPRALNKRYLESPEGRYILECIQKQVKRVVPVLISPCAWKRSEFTDLRILPDNDNQQALDQWGNEASAFQSVVDNIIEVLDLLVLQPPEPSIDALPLKELPPIWKVPPERDPLFTGREGLLNQIYTTLQQQRPPAIPRPLALRGLGGAGKTRLAIEYAYRYRTVYKHVFWVSAEKREELIQEYNDIAGRLKLDPEPNQVTQAVKRCLEREPGWLLIIDNADEIEMVQEFIPSINVGHETNPGHVLLTTREAVVNHFATDLDIKQMDSQEGMLFLLRRGGTIASNVPLSAANQTDQVCAQEVVRLLGGLPLALDQAGAYIAQTQCSIARYLSEYRAVNVELLVKRFGLRDASEHDTQDLGMRAHKHPLSVVRTFSIAFDKVKELDARAAGLLYFFIFLAPDAIPEKLVSTCLSDLLEPPTPPPLSPKSQKTGFPWKIWRRPSNPAPPPSPVSEAPNQEQQAAFSQMKLDEVSGVLLRFSLIHREAGSFTIHRLVQDVLKHSLQKPEQRQWAERAVRAVSATFPKVEIDTWQECKQLLPQALACATAITTYDLDFPEAMRLLNDTGLYFAQIAQYKDAEVFYQQVLSIRRKAGGWKDPASAQSLHHMAELSILQSKFPEAEDRLKRALEIRTQALGLVHPDTAATQERLASLYTHLGKYREAEQLYHQAYSIYEKTFGLQDPATLKLLTNLGRFYQAQKKYKDAEALYRRALSSLPQSGKGNLAVTAEIQHYMADLAVLQGRLDEAEALHQQALTLRTEVFGEEYPETATSMHHLAQVYALHHTWQEAERLYKRAWEIREKLLGARNPETATTIYGLAKLYQDRKKLKEAEDLLHKALLIWKDTPGLFDPLTLRCHKDLAHLYEIQGRVGEAAQLYKRALLEGYRKKRPNASALIQMVREGGRLSDRQNLPEDKEQLYEQAFDFFVQQWNVDHPVAIECSEVLERLYIQRHQSAKRERLLSRSFELRLPLLKAEEPTLSLFQKNLDALLILYEKQHKIQEVQQLYHQAMKACSHKLGYDHPLMLRIEQDMMRFCDQHKKPEIKRDWYIQKLRRLFPNMRRDNPRSVEMVLGCVDTVIDMQRVDNNYLAMEQTREEALRTCYQTLGADHPQTSKQRRRLAQLYEEHGKPDEAERMCQEALAVCKDVGFPLTHQVTLECKNDLARYYWKHRKYDMAKEIIVETWQRIDRILLENPGAQEYYLVAAHSYVNAAYYCWRRGGEERKRIKPLMRRAIELSELVQGEDYQDIQAIRQQYKSLLLQMGARDEAAALEINATTMQRAGQSNGQRPYLSEEQEDIAEDRNWLPEDENRLNGQEDDQEKQFIQPVNQNGQAAKQKKPRRKSADQENRKDQGKQAAQQEQAAGSSPEQQGQPGPAKDAQGKPRLIEDQQTSSGQEGEELPPK